MNNFDIFIQYIQIEQFKLVKAIVTDHYFFCSYHDCEAHKCSLQEQCDNLLFYRITGRPIVTKDEIETARKQHPEYFV